MGCFWYVACHYREGLAWLERALARAPGAPAAVRADAANGAGRLAYTLGDFAGAAAHLEGARRLAREAGATEVEVWATLLLGILAEDRGEYATAEEHLVAAGRLLAAGPADPGAPTDAVFIAYHRGVVAFGRGDWDSAETHWQEASRRGHGDRQPTRPAQLPRLPSAPRAHARRPPREPPASCASASPRQARFWRCRPRKSCWPRSPPWRRRAASPRRPPGFWLRRSTWAGAAAILDAQPEGQYCRVAEAKAREALGAAGYAAAWEAGRRLRPEEADAEVEHVLAAAEALTSPIPAPDRHGLTPRELEVLRLAAAGRTNREIAARSSSAPHGEAPPLHHPWQTRRPLPRRRRPPTPAPTVSPDAVLPISRIGLLQPRL